MVAHEIPIWPIVSTALVPDMSLWPVSSLQLRLFIIAPTKFSMAPPLHHTSNTIQRHRSMPMVARSGWVSRQYVSYSIVSTLSELRGCLAVNITLYAQCYD